MGAEIIRFDEAARRVRARRERAPASDLFIAAACVWPISWALVVARSAIGIIVAASGSRP